MKFFKNSSSILWIEGAGFSLIIVIAWIAEALRVPQLVFSEVWTVNWSRPLAKTVIVLLVWVIVHAATRRLLARLHYLEGFLLVCGWCRKIGHDGDWKTTEEYFDTVFDTVTSHGVCPACSKRLVESVESELPRLAPSAARVSPTKRPPVSPPEA